MKADPASQRRLLDLQDVDTNIARTEHRRRTLPETAQAQQLQGDRTRAAERVIAADTRVSDLTAELEKAESDLTPVVQRRERNQQRVDKGEIADPKALSAMLEEIEHLGRRISDLEDAQLEAMENLDGAKALLADTEDAKATIEDEMRAVLKVREGKLAELASELEQHQAERAAIAATIPADLLALYTKVAEKQGGVGAALLRAGRCGGCQLEATASDLERYRTSPADAVLRCEECQRILVRTNESGL